MNNMPIIACYNLGKTYAEGRNKVQVFKGINFEVKASEMIAIVGASGSGKSTLLQLLGGLDKPTHGEVQIEGRNIQHLTEQQKCELRNRRLGFIYQFHHLLPEFTALENVGMPLLIQGQSKQYIKDKANYLLHQVGLEKRISHRIHQLSGGEKQRVAIARALVSDPLCVLADEPTGNLDPKNAERVLDLFLELQVKHKTSVILVTHDPKIANKAHKIYCIKESMLIHQTKY